MRKIILLFMAILPFFANAQQALDSFEIKLTPEGVTPLVVETEGKTAIQLYDNAKLYIAKKFKHPSYVTKADEPGKLLRFESYNSYKGGMMTEGKYTYTCEIEFKEGRYRISFFNLRRASGIQVLSDCYNKEGNLRDGNFYQKLYTNFNDLVNTAHQEIKQSLLNAEKSDW